MQSSVQILSYIETPVRWCPILVENKVCLLSLKQKFHQLILQHSKVCFTVDRCSFKKERPIHTLLHYGAEHVHLRRISHMLLYCMKMYSSPYACVVFVDFASYVEGCFVTKHKTIVKSVFFQHQTAFGYKSLRVLICRCLSNAGANAVYKVSHAGVFLPLAKQLLKASEVQD